MITIKTGDLLHATETIIGHQVNCCGAAGGLAAAVFRKYHDAENDYDQVIGRLQSAGGVGYSLLGTTMLSGQRRDGHIIANIFRLTLSRGRLQTGRAPESPGDAGELCESRRLERGPAMAHLLRHLRRRLD